jgi:hypothetical protein
MDITGSADDNELTFDKFEIFPNIVGMVGNL